MARLIDELRQRSGELTAELAHQAEEVIGGIPDPQTRSGNGYGAFSSNTRVERKAPDKDQTQLYRKLYRHDPYINAGIDLTAGEVARPGGRITTDDDDLTEALRTWEEQCTIYAGEYNQPLSGQLWLDARSFLLTGTVLAEHIYDDPADPDAFTGFQSIDPVTVDFLCYPNTSRLIRPDEAGQNLPSGVPRTARGEAAAYVQNLGLPAGSTYATGSNKQADSSGNVPLSQRDVTKIVRNPMHGTPNDHTGNYDFGNESAVDGDVRGMSIVEPVAPEAIRLQNRKDDYNAALQNLAYPRVFITFKQVELPSGDILEWETGQIQAFIKSLRQKGAGRSGSDGWKYSRQADAQGVGTAATEDYTNDYSSANKGGSGSSGFNSPGGIFGMPPGVEAETKTPEVPDIDETIDRSIQTIFTGMNVPKAYVGFGDDLNRDVTEPRVEQFNRQVKRIRNHLSASYTEVYRKKAKYLLRRGVVSGPEEGSTDYNELINSVTYAIESDESQSPLADEDFDAQEWLNYMKGWQVYIQSGIDSFLPPEHVLEKDLNLDANEIEEALQDVAAAIEAADSEALQNMRNAANENGEAGPPAEGDVSDRVDQGGN